MFHCLHNFDFSMKEGARSVNFCGSVAIEFDDLDCELEAGDLVDGGEDSTESPLPKHPTEIGNVIEEGLLGRAEARKVPRLGFGIVDLGWSIGRGQLLKQLEGALSPLCVV